MRNLLFKIAFVGSTGAGNDQIRFDMTFATYYAKKRAEGKPHRVAITHVAKKLIRIIYALERQDVDYDIQKLR